ncbi:PAS domain S-box-containing protein [Methylobacterium sp. RAS18]|uniref:hybrid sensor histidine kinase/response regulator n=1 Tax=Methylorubrum extorquens TaxID=408 RepID=UPI0015FDD675|nr:hybrid sensor histidine kinase/response regulator [Methylorubrum extorquens]MBA9069859.1 PAS domain S-box-containing protein [Methylobacterium sp. RAS18]MDF9866077.1 PAS domain S-box-containing protein [Methylorubrum pseudosasae]MDH6639629.1 PAS domain S-box-containing protein [Methylobacterium sp. SuP10 SLI 274]MDH6668822.1 PAS domain S-box-containing protein [Methylorubrum zatmanii]MCP1560702.1 PAS domain S-box-containing protein [Methylorubrum extorquens]
MPSSPEKPRAPGPNTPVTGSGAAGVVDQHHDIFFAAVETTRMPMIVTDPHQPDNPIIFANRAFVRMTGYSAEELIGSNCRFLQGPDTDRDTVSEVRDAIREHREFAAEILNYRKDGSSFWNALFVSPVFNRSGDLVYFFGSQLDVSRRRDAEESLHQAQKMESLGQLTGGIAHDFNNLLQVVSGHNEVMLALLDHPTLDVSRMRRAGEAVRAATDRAAKLTHQLLAFSRKQRLEGRLLNLNGLVESMGEMAGRTIGDDVVLKSVLAPDLWTTRIDPTQAEVALLNVLINARDAMPEGGSVTVRTENLLIEDEDTALYKTVPPGAYVVISVTDTGTGMPSEILARVMEPFFTTKGEGKGTGLGLAMVYGFAKQSGGSVKIYSEVGHGTTVRLLFPASDQKAEEEQKPTIRAADRHGTETVLVVDDRPDVAETAGIILEDFGYKVTVVDGPKAALDILDGEGRIDLLFTDLIMPGGMNGVMLARAARERQPKIKVLLTTGYAEASMERTDAGGTEFEIINKPYKRMELARRVRRVIDGPTGVG